MDYGFHTGYLLYHGYFNANGREYNVWLNVSGGAGFGHSVRLNDTLLGSWVGSSAKSTAVHMSLSSVLSQDASTLSQSLLVTWANMRRLLELMQSSFHEVF